MHILIISRSYPNKINKTSGNFVQNQVEALAKHPVNIGVLGVYNVSFLQLNKIDNIKNIGFFSNKLLNIWNLGFLLPIIPKLHYINNRIKLEIGKKLLKKYIKERGLPEIIHLHTFELGLIALWALRKYNIPYIVTEHTTSFYIGTALSWHKKLAYKIYKQSTFNIAVSKESGKDLEQRFGKEFNYLPNFVNTSKFKPQNKIKNSVVNFINVAYLNKKKNHELLIKAFFNAFGNNSNYQLTIVGNGEEKEKLEKLIKLLGISNIRLYGYATQEKITELLQKSDFFVLSSSYETFGVVIIEAMSCGLPVVSTKCGGPESIITSEKLGILCSKEDVNELSNALKRIIMKEYDRQYIRNHTIENFSYESLSEKLIGIYSKFI